MSDTAIKVENLSKRYRIGLAEEMHPSIMPNFVGPLRTGSTLAGALTENEHPPHQKPTPASGTHGENKNADHPDQTQIHADQNMTTNYANSTN